MGANDTNYREMPHDLISQTLGGLDNRSFEMPAAKPRLIPIMNMSAGCNILLLPLNSGRRLGRNIVRHPSNLFYGVGDHAGYFEQVFHGEPVHIGGHAVA